MLAVINELSKHDKSLEVIFVCDRKFADRAERIMSGAPVPVTTKRIFAGKLRRYHNVSLVKQLLDIPTLLQNIGDLFLIGLGFMQSLFLLLLQRPQVVFTKGGFVCLPVGLAAALFKIPLVIHDSDAHPGLTNRILARFATTIATGAPLDNYSYPAARSHYVGIPVDAAFVPFSAQEQVAAKDALGLPDITLPLVVVTGGGLGARRVNNAILAVGEQLVEQAAIMHITGEGQFDDVKQKAPVHANYIVVPFVHTGMAQVLGAADIVITRAGATTLLELAALAKATIIIPNDMLTGGHQTKNAKVYADAEAAIVLTEQALEEAPMTLLDELQGLLNDSEKRQQLGERMHAFARPDAALDTAELIVSAAHLGKKSA